MMHTPHFRAACVLAFAAAFAMPAAFAQDAAATAKDDAAKPADAAAAPAKTTWADLDADHNGSLDKHEAAALPALAKVFDKADTNADGTLTGEEYKAYLDANGNGQTQGHESH